jgi:hypothetical protein
MLVLIDKGIPQSFFNNISTFLTPVELILTIYLSNLNTKFLHKYMLGFEYLIYIYSLEMLFISFYYKIDNFDYSLPHIPLILFVLFLNITKKIFIIISYIGLSGFFHKISDDMIGATYITTLNSIKNISIVWPEFIIFYLVDIFGHNTIGIFSVFYSFIFLIKFKNIFIKLDELDYALWKIDDKIN